MAELTLEEYKEYEELAKFIKLFDARTIISDDGITIGRFYTDVKTPIHSGKGIAVSNYGKQPK